MNTIPCAQCGEENQQDFENCNKCGAALISQSFWDINGDGEVNFADITAFLSMTANKAGRACGHITNNITNIFRSKEKKDQEAINQLFANSEFESHKNEGCTQQQFKDALRNTINLKITEILASKPDGKKYLNFIDAQVLTISIHNIFTTLLTFTPRQVSAACALSKAILAASKKDKQNLVKAAIGFSGGTAGIGMVISAIGTALGWGAGVITSITAIFVSSSFLGPIMWGTAGLSLAAIAGYFATTSNHEVDTERFINVLQDSLDKAVEAIWVDHGEKLSESVGKI